MVEAAHDEVFYRQSYDYRIVGLRWSYGDTIVTFCYQARKAQSYGAEIPIKHLDGHPFLFQRQVHKFHIVLFSQVLIAEVTISFHGRSASALAQDYAASVSLSQKL